jgi:hypothetical protein
MSPARARNSCCLLLLYVLLSSPALAQYEVETQQSVWLRALLDLRVVGGGPAPSWTDHGPGKMRYGGSNTPAGFERATRLVLSQAALQLGASLPWGMRAQLQMNIEPDIADGYHPWLVEAILRREWGNGEHGWGVQTGLANVPFSLEHSGPAWTPEYTLSASALNSWLWEDISLVGMEGEWWHTTDRGMRLGALLGAGYGGDQIGRLLALRGWDMGDVIGGANGDLALPTGTQRTDIFVERDHRPALYSWLSLADEGETAALKLGIFDNRGNEDHSGVWHTHFNIMALVLHLPSRIDVLAQYLDGVARVSAPPNDSAVSAYYVLVSHHFQTQRLSVRYDSFRVHDLDGGPNSTNEHGHAVTGAYLVQIGLRCQVALEYIWMNSHRDVSGTLNPTPDGWQMSFRFRY